MTLAMASAFAVVLVSYLLALSSTVTFASSELVVPLPHMLVDLLGRFRSTGRLFWIGAFWLVLIGIAAIVGHLGARRGAIVLSVLVIVQFVDVYGIAANIRRSIAGFHHMPVPAELASIVKNSSYKALAVIPPWECDNQTTPGSIRNYETFGFLAVRAGLVTNNFYAARTPYRQTVYQCNYGAVLAEPDPHNLYVLSDTMYQKYHGQFGDSFSCHPVYGLQKSMVCSAGPVRK